MLNVSHVLPKIFFTSMSTGVGTLQDSPSDPKDPRPCIVPPPSVWAALTDLLLMNKKQWKWWDVVSGSRL